MVSGACILATRASNDLDNIVNIDVETRWMTYGFSRTDEDLCLLLRWLRYENHCR